MRQMVDNQVRLSPKSEEQMAQLTPEQRETQMKISTTITQGVFLAGPVFLLGMGAVIALVLWGTINFGFGGKATVRHPSLPSGCTPCCPPVIKTFSGIAFSSPECAPDRFNIKNFAPTNLGAFLNPADTNPALYRLRSRSMSLPSGALLLSALESRSSPASSAIRLHRCLRLVGPCTLVSSGLPPSRD